MRYVVGYGPGRQVFTGSSLAAALARSSGCDAGSDLRCCRKHRRRRIPHAYSRAEPFPGAEVEERRVRQWLQEGLCTTFCAEVHAETICVVRTPVTQGPRLRHDDPDSGRSGRVVVGTHQRLLAPGSSDWAVWPDACIRRRSRCARAGEFCRYRRRHLTHLCDRDAARALRIWSAALDPAGDRLEGSASA